MPSDKIKYFFPKLFNRLRLYRNRLWKYCNVERVAMRGYKPFDNAIAFKSRIQDFLGKYDINILVGISDEDENVIISCAEQTLRHEFDLLGSGPVVLNPIDWHIDFKTGARWNKLYYQEIRGIKGSDIKVPWEISRCQHLLWLGEAYLLTGEERYAKEVIDEINWWIDDNPFMYSVNWRCAMDVAFRAVNWMYALNMITKYKDFDCSFTSKVAKSLWQHAFFIRNNLEQQIPYSNNHYASDIVGLLYIGALFKNTIKGKRWFMFALKEYYSEVKMQVLKSGVHYERSVSYHRLMTELFSYPAYMLQRTGVKIPDDVLGRIKGMYEYVTAYTKPNGLAPLIADNDDGRFVPFVRRDFLRHSYLNEKQSVENRFAAHGANNLFCTSTNNSHFYPDAGVGVLRKGNNYLYINHGGYSKHPQESDVIIGTHTHNDLLSFELCMNGRDVLVDAGTYMYTSYKKVRDEFRSTAKHNTIVVDGEEQNGFHAPFELNRNVHKGGLKQVCEDVYEGGYTTIEGQMHHTRRFVFKDGELIITDTIQKTGTGHVAKIYFHFADGVTVQINDNHFITNNNAQIDFGTHPDSLEIVDDTLSPSFGVLVKSKTGVATFRFENELTITTTIKFIV